MQKKSDPVNQIRSMFSSVASWYDFLNRLLSIGLDQRWRAIAAKEVRPVQDGLVLDLACGTGDLAIKILKNCPSVTEVIGADLSLEMLLIARKKLAAKGYGGKSSFQQARAEQLPYKDEIFSGAAIAFGIRNFVDRLMALREVHRLLKPGASLVVLEFSLPSHFLFRAIYQFYLTKLLPFLAGLFSDRQAYRYLSLSVTNFPAPGDFAALLTQAGFQGVVFQPLSAGIVTLYRAERPPSHSSTLGPSRSVKRVRPE